ncbi:MAG: nicotinate-nucleotide adenylyltransferase [Vallitalea sp.]|jgi:nicotinate-nucleotide adenylyltransferase|nr:nicotinate-nucleotide adenylyltransferase [Vallitalea sp.]
MKESTVGIMGGTFDPIHYGHLILAEYVLNEMNLDKIIFIPSGTPHLKSYKKVSTKKNRLKMTELGIKNNNNFKISTIEIDREGNTYTIDTIKELNKKYTDTLFYFIIGADSLFDLLKWKDIEKLFDICNFIVANRGGTYSLNELQDRIKLLTNEYNAYIKLVNIPDIQISSSDIRNRIKQNKSIKYLLPGDVEKYIYKNKLYVNNEYNNELIKKELKKHIDTKRYNHTLGVEKTAVALAKIHDIDISKANVAALLHDCAKNISNNKKIDLCKKYNIELKIEEKKNPDLVHAKVGSVIAKHIYNINDSDIINAIAYHTTGRPNMSELEKVIYISDYIEPGRTKANNLDNIRKLARKDLDKALLAILEDTIAYLQSKNKIIDTLTIEAYEFYKLHNNTLSNE